MGIERRRDIRIKYPRDDRPLVEIKGRQFPVVDLSASGMKVIMGSKKFSKGAVFEVKVHFGKRRTYMGRAEVVRSLGDLLMLKFEKRVEISVMKLEADYLLKRYGSLET